MLGRIIKIFISSILQRKPRIFIESFLLGGIIKKKYFFKSAKKTQDIQGVIFQICKEDPVYLGFFLLGRIIKIFISSNLLRRTRIFKEFFLCLVE